MRTRWVNRIIGTFFGALVLMAVGLCVFHAMPVEREPEGNLTDTRLDDAESAESARPSFEPDCILVRPAEGVTPAEMESALSEAGLAGATVGDWGRTFAKIALPAGTSVNEALARLSACPTVESAQPNFYYYLADDETSADAAAASALQQQSAQAVASLVVGTAFGDALGVTQAASEPNDPYYSRQWALPSVNALDAWTVAAQAAKGNAESGLKPVTIAVMDEGFKGDHDDLQGNVAFTYNATNSSSQLNQVSGKQSHGTHVAGIAGAVTNNALGVASITDSICQIGLMQVFDTKGSATTEWLVDALDYVCEHAEEYNIRVVNMSLGAGSSTEVPSTMDDELYAAIDRARDAGIVTVAASCNSGTTYDENKQICYAPFYAWPSDFDNVVSVINVQQTSSGTDGVALASGSNYNKGTQRAKNISAPGTIIWSCDSTYSTANKGYYSSKSGTSMASPLVAGVLGLMFTTYPDLSPELAVSKLYGMTRDITATGIGWDAKTGYGEVDAAAAVSDRPYLAGTTSLMSGESTTWAVMLGAESQTGFTWSASDESVATVDEATGVVTAVAKPAANTTATATITATSTSNPLVKATMDIVVLSNDIADDRFSIGSLDDVTYDGTRHEPVPVVQLGPHKLSAGDDFTVEYSGNVNAGAAVATVRGKGAYQGSVTRSFAIEKAPMSAADISLSETSLSYDGTARAPFVAVRDIGLNAGNVLASGVDYALEPHAVRTGSGSVTVTALEGCRNFTGSVERGFTVASPPASTDNTASETSGASSGASEASGASPAASSGASPATPSEAKSSDGGASGSMSSNAGSNVGNGALPSVKAGSAATVSPQQPAAARRSVYRLYNPNTGEHFYTISVKERRALKAMGWVYEGVAWKTPVKSNVPVYRLYNKVTGDHLFTKSRAERNKLRRGDWKYEGISWYAAASGGEKVYRLYNRKARIGAHLLTASTAEKRRLVKRGWKFEGVL